MSSTSDDVSPKWIQRPAGPADEASTSTKAATSWSVTASRSFTASTVKVAFWIASRSAAVGPSSASAAATSTSRQAVIRASSVQIGAELGTGVAADHCRHRMSSSRRPEPTTGA